MIKNKVSDQKSTMSKYDIIDINIIEKNEEDEKLNSLSQRQYDVKKLNNNM